MIELNAMYDMIDYELGQIGAAMEELKEIAPDASKLPDSDCNKLCQIEGCLDIAIKILERIGVRDE